MMCKPFFCSRGLLNNRKAKATARPGRKTPIVVSGGSFPRTSWLSVKPSVTRIPIASHLRFGSEDQENRCGSVCRAAE
jgi:hypothetical protein